MDAITKARGGVKIRPVLEDDSTVEINVFIDIATEIAIGCALAKLVARIPDLELMIEDASYSGLANRFISQALMLQPHDYAAILVAVSEVVLTFEECLKARLTQVDKEKIAAALSASLAQKEDYTDAEWKKLNDAKTSPEVYEAAQAFIPASLLWPQCLGCKHKPSMDGQDVN